jgi:hypothetical protein
VKTYWAAASLWAIPALVVGGAAGYALRPTTHAGQFEQPALAAVPEKAFPGVRINYAGSGTFRVPSQVTPGTYIVTTSGLTFGCSWVRLKADDDKPKSEIDSGTVNRGGFDRFTVGSSDRVLKLFGDCMWAAS